MTDGSTLLTVAMVAMTVVMMDGMVAVGAWAFVRRRRNGGGSRVSSATSSLEVARGVHRLGTRWANFYPVVDGGEGLLIDSGYPG
ncbi:MAG: hypothetical protein ACRDK9_04890 [Solirubrobacterales bacterium]